MTGDMFASLKESEVFGGDIRETTTTLRFDFGDVIVEIHNVPVADCPGVDELIVPGPLAVRLNNFAKQVAEAARGLGDEDAPFKATAEFPLRPPEAVAPA